MSIRLFAVAVLVVTASVMCPRISAAQVSAAELPGRIDAVFARFDAATPGCGVGLSRDGAPIFVRGYGAANLEYRVPNTDSTVFESGSVAKQFTAASLVLLQTEGRLTLDDDIRRHLPEVPAFGQGTITIRHLLTHTSGLRDQWGLLAMEGRGAGTQVHSPATTLDLVRRQRQLNFAPGSAYLYSNTGYALAGIIVQRVSGQSLDAFMQERFFRPLGMTHTQWRDDYAEIVPNRATAYSGNATTGYRADMPFTNMVGNGGLLSTMRDLMRWNAHLDAPSIGGATFTRAMETRMRLTNGRVITYALGLDVDAYDGVREVGHGGSTAGYRTYLARYPDQRVSVAVWCNNAGANPTLLAHQVADLVLTKPARAAPVAVQRAPIPAAEMRRWAGLYRDVLTDATLMVAAQDTVLVATGGGVPRPLVPVGQSRFVGAAGAAEFTGGPGRRSFVLVRPGADTARFEEVKPVPSPLRLADYVGTFTSDELDARSVIAEEAGSLVLTRRHSYRAVLRPVHEDDFQMGDGGTVRFTRDAAGRVAGFSVFAGRVLDVRFVREAQSASAR